MASLNTNKSPCFEGGDNVDGFPFPEMSVFVTVAISINNFTFFLMNDLIDNNQKKKKKKKKYSQEKLVSRSLSLQKLCET